jgi:hypothetical protein
VEDRCDCGNEVGAFLYHRGLVFMKNGFGKRVGGIV